MDKKTLLEDVSNIVELNDIYTFMNDPVVDEALDLVVRLSVKENVPPNVVPPLILKVKALSAQCAIKAKYYTVFEKAGPDNSKKKNVYYTLHESLDAIANALKFVAKM